MINGNLPPTRHRHTAKLACGLVLVFVSCFADYSLAQSTRERGLGPYTLVTKRGETTARILRREGDMIWIDRLLQSGNYVETGVPKQEIVEFKSPRPPIFDLADKAESPEQIASVIEQLRRMIAQLRIYRDLPGIPVHEAILLTAQLNERREFWRDALQQYEELLAQKYEMPDRPIIRYRSGLCLWNMQQKEKALTFLLDEPIPDDDLNLLSSIIYARADCLAAVGRHREAIDSFLSLVVFYPYAQTNEARALSGILPSFIAIQDWDAVMKSIEALQRDYPESPHTVAADTMLSKYTEKVESQRQFQVNQE